MSRALIYTLIAFLAVLLIPGCSSKEITREDVTGNYFANFPDDQVAYDTLEVRPDGTYTHAFKSADGETAFTEDGTWDFKYYDGPYERKPEIIFRNYTLVHIEPYKEFVLKKGVMGSDVKNDGYRFIISSESFFHYDKQQ